MARLAPSLFALLVFAVGAVTLLSAAAPEDLPRLRVLAAVAPPGLIDLSHFVSSLAGVMLLFLAFGLRDRLRRAWALAVGVLIAAMAACLLKGLGLAEAGFLAAVAGLLIGSRGAFHRAGEVGRAPISPGGVAAILGVLIAAGCLGRFAYRDVAYRNALWWTFLTEAGAPRSSAEPKQT